MAGKLLEGTSSTLSQSLRHGFHGFSQIFIRENPCLKKLLLHHGDFHFVALAKVLADGFDGSSACAMVVRKSCRCASNAFSTRAPAMYSCVPGGWPSGFWPSNKICLGAAWAELNATNRPATNASGRIFFTGENRGAVSLFSHVKKRFTSVQHADFQVAKRALVFVVGD